VDFSQEEILRYARHFSLQDIGLAGQQKIKQTRVLLVGAGGIGSPAAFYLAAAGIGSLGLIDPDVVEISNLQRQILYRSQDLGHLKVECAKDRILELNPFVEVKTYPYSLSPENASKLFQEYDYILDGTDNYPTRYLVNDACRKSKRPLLSASIFQFSGQVAGFKPWEGPCYRCLYPEPPPQELIPNCAQAGVLGVLPGILGLCAVNQILKDILKIGDPIFKKLIEFDALALGFHTVTMEENPNCPCCKQGLDFVSTQTHCELRPDQIQELSPQDLQRWQKEQRSFVLLDVREPWEREMFAILPSVHIPLKELRNAKLPFSKETPVVVHCKSGKRSLMGAMILQERGMPSLWNLSGGADRWLKEIAS